MDINKTTHMGTAISNPSFLTLSNKPFAVFSLKVRESWTDSSGTPKHRDNIFKVEAWGQKAFWIKSNVKVGRRYYIDGYLRFDCINDKEEVKIRVYNIEADGSETFTEGKKMGSLEALKKALNLVKSSDTLDSAITKLEVLVDES